jgi:hypothetical protein
MPTWWTEALQLLHTFGFWFALAALLIGVILRYLVMPYFTRVHEGLKKAACQTNLQFDSNLHPSDKDKAGHPILITRYEMKKEMEDLTKIVESKVTNLHSIIGDKCCTENCPVFKPLKDMILNNEAREQAFLDNLLKLRKETQSDINELHKRLDSFFENVLDKRDDIIAKQMALMERMAASERKNGGQ